MSAKSVMHMKQFQFTETGSGQICSWTGEKNTCRENTRKFQNKI